MIPVSRQKKDLAIFGAKPRFTEKLHVNKPNIGNRDVLIQRLNDILDRRWLTNEGIYVKELEKRIADLIGVKHCIAMCNATVALELTIRALELRGEVIIPSFTFIATAHALQFQEITPVFCDIDPKTHNLDPEKVEAMITPKTTGIIGVHLWGRPCEIESLESIAKIHNLRLLFDAAHAFGCSHNGTMIGNFGEAEILSFHATKFVNTFEGGAVVTNNDELALKISLMKNFGFAGYDNVIYIGTNGKMSEISAAMGVTSLESMPDFIETNLKNYECYLAELGGLEGISMALYNENEKCNYQYIVIEVDEERCGLQRDDLLKVLHAENVLARRYYWPGCHCMEPYRSYFPHANLLLGETEKLAERVLVLPNGTGVTLDEIREVCDIIQIAIVNASLVKQRLALSNH